MIFAHVPSNHQLSQQMFPLKRGLGVIVKESEFLRCTLPHWGRAIYPSTAHFISADGKSPCLPLNFTHALFHQNYYAVLSIRKWIPENNRNIVGPHRGITLSVVIGSVGQPTWIGTPSEILRRQIVPQPSRYHIILSLCANPSHL